jgi:hypothetical protein
VLSGTPELAIRTTKYVGKLLECAEGVQFVKPKPGDLPAGETACEACLAGRINESFNKTTDNREQLKVQRLHADISGIKSCSTRGYQYFLLVADDATRQCWVALLRDKSAPEAVSKCKQLAKQIERESNAQIVFVRSDNSRGEFGAMFQEALLQEGVQFEPYKHSLNGVIERAIGKINAMIRRRRLKIDSQVPGGFINQPDLANQIQAILYLGPSNPKDFDRGCRNTKCFRSCVRIESNRSRLSKSKTFCI